MKRKVEKDNGNRTFKLILFISVLAVTVVLLLISSFIMEMYFISGWDQGDAPFIILLIKNVIVIGFWGVVCLILGLLILFGSAYAIITKKAAQPNKLVAPASFLVLCCFGFSYFFLGTGWMDYVSDVRSYYSEGPREKTIILQDYEVIRGNGIHDGANEYVYTSANGEKFLTNTVFKFDLTINKEYQIKYLPKTKYLIGIK
jgi:hypothetical protein